MRFNFKNRNYGKFRLSHQPKNVNLKLLEENEKAAYEYLKQLPVLENDPGDFETERICFLKAHNIIMDKSGEMKFQSTSSTIETTGGKDLSPVGRLKYPKLVPLLTPDPKDGFALELLFCAGKTLAGGKMGKKALIRAHTLAGKYLGQKAIKAFAPLAMACKMLLMRDSVKDFLKYLCQSLFAKVTDLPVTSQMAEEAKGQDEDKISTVTVPSPTRIYRPDREVEKLRQGATTWNIVDGGLGDNYR